jgi:heat shock protein HslJ
MAAAGIRAAALALACSACTSIHADQRTFDGTRWRVIAIDGHATPPDNRYFIAFGPVGFTGRIGCNTIQGGYRVLGERLVPGMTMATQAACVVDAIGVIQPMTYEKWAFGVLRQPMRINWISGQRITLSNAAGSIELERQR